MQVIISGEIDIFFNLNILLQPQPIFNDCIVKIFKFSKGWYVLLKSTSSPRADTYCSNVQVLQGLICIIEIFKISKGQEANASNNLRRNWHFEGNEILNSMLVIVKY